MKYSKDLLKRRKKSKIGIAFGVFIIIVAISLAPVRLLVEGSVSGYHWPYTIIFLLNGLNQLMAGLGYSIDRLMGKAFIEIDNKVIRLKISAFGKEQNVSWDKINSIEYRPNKFIVTKKDKTQLVLSIYKLEYSVIQEIKNTIKEIANEKKILLSGAI